MKRKINRRYTKKETDSFIEWMNFRCEYPTPTIIPWETEYNKILVEYIKALNEHETELLNER